ncbi:MAG: MBL fold metallo-hydrolase [Verrucomicrobiae bacterium]|nr:MBL fold metallo-hydrolase [Verrucomicrobiae bacterium]
MTVHPIDLHFRETPEIIAAFLVVGPDGLVLVETGPGSTLPQLLTGIAELGFSPSDVRDVFVTHIHLDHAGAAGWWAQENGSTIYVHPKGARHLIDPSRLMESARMVYGDLMDTLWGDMIPAPEERVRILEDNETVSVAGLDFTALNTPGHARHHHAYAVEDAIFTGDVAGARLPECDYLSVTSAPPQFDPDAYFASIERLKKADPARLFLTHFGEVTDVAVHLDDYRENVDLASTFVRDRLNEGMDADALQIAYQAFQMEIAFRSGLPPEDWNRYQQANPTSMCADGIRLYWEKQSENPK